jgi:type IV pilus assembly protein PilX
MRFRAATHRLAQRGVVLITSLLLLIVVTLIALSLFRSFGIQEKIAGNMREKQRALQAAESAEVYAEIWLDGNAATTAAGPCVTRLNANFGEGQICGTQLQLTGATVTSPPWIIGGQPVDVTYLPPGMPISTNTSVTSAAPTYYKTPAFYISDLGASADGTQPGEVYQIDAYGYGGGASTVAVVESTYLVYTTSAQH